jgi:DNA polymerase I-like protein with 3'-5' exonuclease and polymerase domains
MAYGAQPKKVAQSTGLDLEVVEKIFAKEAETYTESAKLAERVKSQIEASAKYSSALDIPRSLKSDKTILGNVELLPIFDNDGNTHYTKQDIRRVGYWQSETGLKCSFADTGRYTKAGIKRSFSFTQPKNYPMQSHAAIIQGMTTAALLKTLVAKSDKVKMCLEIHDSKVFLVREDVLQPVCKWLKDTIEDVPKLMSQRFGVDVPFKFPIDFSVGDNLTDVESYEV